MFYCSSYVKTWGKSQYLLFNERKSYFIISRVFGIYSRCHKLTYFKEMSLVKWCSVHLSFKNSLLSNSLFWIFYEGCNRIWWAIFLFRRLSFLQKASKPIGKIYLSRERMLRLSYQVISIISSLIILIIQVKFVHVGWKLVSREWTFFVSLTMKILSLPAIKEEVTSNLSLVKLILTRPITVLSGYLTILRNLFY